MSIASISQGVYQDSVLADYRDAPLLLDNDTATGYPNAGPAGATVGMSALLNICTLQPVHKFSFTIVYEDLPSFVLEYSSDFVAWTHAPYTAIPLAAGGGMQILFTRIVTLTSDITAQYWRFSAKDQSTSGVAAYIAFRETHLFDPSGTEITCSGSGGGSSSIIVPVVRLVNGMPIGGFWI